MDRPALTPRSTLRSAWQGILDGNVDWIVSDHPCCSSEVKGARRAEDDVWLAKAGFGGTEYLLSGVFSEGRRRGLTEPRIAELTAWNPARRFGLTTKGDIALGYDADLALLDPTRRFVVQAAESPSSQGYTPFEGQELTGQVQATFLRGHLIYERGAVVGPPRGRFVRRPAPPS